MSSIGHGSDTASRDRQNRAYSKARREKTAVLRQLYIKQCEKRAIIDKHIDRQELEKIKQDIRQQIKQQQVRAIFFSLTITGILLVIILGILFL